MTTSARVPLFEVAANPDPDSTLPFLIRLPLPTGELVLKAHDSWPRTAKVYCHRAEQWPRDPEIVERVPIRSCQRRGVAIDLVLDRPRENRSQLVFTRIQGGREGIFWQTPRTTRQARPGIRVPRRLAAGLAELTILIDTRERYPYKFAQQQASIQRQALPAGDYGIAHDSEIIAVVERKSLHDLVPHPTIDPRLNVRHSTSRPPTAWGPTIDMLAAQAAQQRQFLRRSAESVESLAQAAGQLIRCTVLDQVSVVTVTVASGNTDDGQVLTAVGNRRPAHITASRKIFLAHQKASIDAYVTRDLTRFTPTSITDPDRLRAECRRVRAQRYATDNHEFTASVCCIAVPAWAEPGRGALSTSWTTDEDIRVSDSVLAAIRPRCGTSRIHRR